MSQRIVTSEQEREMLVRFISEQDLPFTASIAKGKNRSVEQNRLQRLWIGEIAEQWDGMPKEQIRGYCKLTIGVPIMREEHAEFREKYDAIIRPLPYEQKLALMCEPLDFPVTRLMTTKQKKHYLDSVQQHFSEKGIVLTNPEDQRWAA